MLEAGGSYSSWNRKRVSDRVDQRALRWFGHVERMDEYQMTRTASIAEVSRARVRGRPRLGWMDSVKVELGRRRG